MIWADGQEWGTATEIAARLTPTREQRHLDDGTTPAGVTVAMVRRWHYTHHLPKARMRDGNGRPQVRYAYGPAALVERDTYDTPQGRRCQLDSVLVAA